MKRRRPARSHVCDPGPLRPHTLMTLNEVAEIMGISKTRAGQIETSALNKLRRAGLPLYQEWTGHDPVWKYRHRPPQTPSTAPGAPRAPSTAPGAPQAPSTAPDTQTLRQNDVKPALCANPAPRSLTAPPPPSSHGTFLHGQRGSLSQNQSPGWPPWPPVEIPARPAE